MSLARYQHCLVLAGSRSTEWHLDAAVSRILQIDFWVTDIIDSFFLGVIHISVIAADMSNMHHV
jgi:hypothetical protein